MNVRHSNAGEHDTWVEDDGRSGEPSIGPMAVPPLGRRLAPAQPQCGSPRGGGVIRRRSARLEGGRVHLLAIDQRERRALLGRMTRVDVLLAEPRERDALRVRRSIHAPARHDQLAPGVLPSSCIHDDGVGRSREPQKRRARAKRLARSFGLGLGPTYTANSFAAARSAVTTSAGDNRRRKLQLHRRGTYLYWHTLSAVPLATSHARAHEALPRELADPAHEPSSNPS